METNPEVMFLLQARFHPALVSWKALTVAFTTSRFLTKIQFDFLFTNLLILTENADPQYPAVSHFTSSSLVSRAN